VSYLDEMRCIKRCVTQYVNSSFVYTLRYWPKQYVTIWPSIKRIRKKPSINLYLYLSYIYIANKSHRRSSNNNTHHCYSNCINAGCQPTPLYNKYLSCIFALYRNHSVDSTIVIVVGGRVRRRVALRSQWRSIVVDKPSASRSQCDPSITFCDSCRIGGCGHMVSAVSGQRESLRILVFEQI
jgi:hypothetical protein